MTVMCLVNHKIVRLAVPTLWPFFPSIVGRLTLRWNFVSLFCLFPSRKANGESSRRKFTEKSLVVRSPLAPGQQTFVRGDREVVRKVQDVLLRDEAGAVVGLRC